MKKNTFAAIISTCVLCAWAWADSAMVGDCAMREASVWFRSELPVQNIKASLSDGTEAVTVLTPARDGLNSAKFSFQNLKPATKYSYKISDGEKILAEGSFRTKPDYLNRTPAPDFSFAALGSNYINQKDYDEPFRTPGGEYGVFESVAKSAPDFVIWTDGCDTLRPADSDSRFGYAARYAYSRENPESKNLLANFSNIGVASENSMGTSGAQSSLRKIASQNFGIFWANPPKPFEDVECFSFTYSDAEIFVLDDISAREVLDYQSDTKNFLGQKQMRWLMSALQNSSAKFKIVVLNSPFVNPVGKNPKNFASADRERAYLMDFLAKKKIGGIVFIAGNKGYFEATRLVRAGAYPLYEITAGPLTNRPDEKISEMNYFRMPSSGFVGRGFITVKIDGPQSDRKLAFSIRDSKGDVKFSSSISEKELYSFE